MKKTMLISLLGFLITASLVTAQTPAPTTPPAKVEPVAAPPSKAVMVTDMTEFEFGWIPSDSYVSHAYWFYSRGEDSLKILSVQPGWGCTKAPLQKEVIAVGDSGSVELIFHSTAGQKGKIAKSATVRCNDPQRGTFTLKLSSTVYDKSQPDSLKPVTLSASHLNWVPADKAKEQKLIVKNSSVNPVKMKLVSQPFGFATIEVPDGEIKQGKTKEIKVKVDKNFSGADFKKSFTVELSDSAKTRFTVPVVLGEPDAPIVTRPAPTKKVPYVDTTKVAPLQPRGNK